MSEDLFERWRRRLFSFSFGRFFADIDEIIREFEEAFKDLEKSLPKELVREMRLPEGGYRRELGPFVYGYSVTIGPDGKPRIREFGNLRPSLTGKPIFDVSAKREPLVDIIDEEKSLRIVAEMPGVEKDQIRLNCTSDRLTIAVDAERKYYKELDLPTQVKPQSATATYKNGILEVRLEKAKPSEGTRIKIE